MSKNSLKGLELSEKIDPRISLIERLRIQLSGHIYIGEKFKEGWKEPIPHYAFNCPAHGIIVDYPHGYNQRLECPLCREERASIKKSI